MCLDVGIELRPCDQKSGLLSHSVTSTIPEGKKGEISSPNIYVLCFVVGRSSRVPFNGFNCSNIYRANMVTNHICSVNVRKQSAQT